MDPMLVSRCEMINRYGAYIVICAWHAPRACAACMHAYAIVFAEPQRLRLRGILVSCDWKGCQWLIPKSRLVQQYDDEMRI